MFWSHHWSYFSCKQVKNNLALALDSSKIAHIAFKMETVKER
jgi:hypothetical protein